MSARFRMDRNGSGRDGEPKLTIPKESFEQYPLTEDKSLPYLPIIAKLPSGEEVELRMGCRANVFAPDLPAHVSGLTARLVVEEIHESDAVSGGGAAAASASSFEESRRILVEAGDVDGLQALYEGLEGIGPKRARKLAEAAIAS